MADRPPHRRIRLPRTTDDFLLGLDRTAGGQGLRAFFASTIASSVLAWNVMFELGAYHTVFYWRILDILVISSVLLIGSFVLRDRVRVRPWTRAILAIPLVWLVARFLQPFGADSAAEHRADLVLIGLSVASLPVSLFAAARIVAPDYFTLPTRRLKIAAVVIVVVIGVAGLLVGQFNYRFTTCQDFNTAGDNEPGNCHKAHSDPTLWETPIRTASQL